MNNTFIRRGSAARAHGDAHRSASDRATSDSATHSGKIQRRIMANFRKESFFGKQHGIRADGTILNPGRAPHNKRTSDLVVMHFDPSIGPP